MADYLTEEDRRLIAEGYEAGKLRVIPRGVSGGDGVEYKPVAGTKRTPTTAKVHRYTKEGRGVLEIAKILLLSPNTVRYHINLQARRMRK